MLWERNLLVGESNIVPRFHTKNHTSHTTGNSDLEDLDEKKVGAENNVEYEQKK